MAETHLSVLVFLGDRVYKLKKGLDVGFADFRAREDRLAVCRREVALNRRLAPDVYLGVVDLVGEDGEPVDHAVVMRRLPASRRLSALVAEGDPEVDEHVRATARLLVGLHERAERSAAIDEAAGVDAVRANWAESVAQLDPLTGPLLDPEASSAVATLVDRYLAGRAPLFAARLAGGHACDGHGDLQADDIFCLPDGPRVLDCIEFRDRYRWGDVAADVAFLAMDLDRLGAPEVGAAFVTAYEELAGHPFPRSLLAHYIAYRAHVRCKVAALRWSQLGDGPDRDAAGAEARRLLGTTRRYLERARVRLVLVGGLPGTGKSTLAAAVGDALGATVLRSDAVRKELAGIDPLEPAPAPYGEGLYAPEVSDRVHRVLLKRAGHALGAGESVVLDASWHEADRRVAARDLAGSAVADLHELRCDLPSELAAARLRERAERGGDPSDATEEVAAAMAARFDPWPEATPVETRGEPAETAAAALEVLGVGGLRAPDALS